MKLTINLAFETKYENKIAIYNNQEQIALIKAVIDKFPRI